MTWVFTSPGRGARSRDAGDAPRRHRGGISAAEVLEIGPHRHRIAPTRQAVECPGHVDGAGEVLGEGRRAAEEEVRGSEDVEQTGQPCIDRGDGPLTDAVVPLLGARLGSPRIARSPVRVPMRPMRDLDRPAEHGAEHHEADQEECRDGPHGFKPEGLVPSMPIFNQ